MQENNLELLDELKIIAELEQCGHTDAVELIKNLVNMVAGMNEYYLEKLKDIKSELSI